MGAVTYRASSRASDAMEAYGVVRDLTGSYPGFRRWFLTKAVPDLATGRGVMVLAEQDGQVVGLALGKRGPPEAKLRCLRVVPRLRGRGAGLHLTDRILREIGEDRPLCTVPQDLVDGYAPMMVNRFGFALTSVAKGLYRPGALEYVFNGPPGARARDLRGS